MKIQKYQVVIEDLMPIKQVLKLWKSIGLEVVCSSHSLGGAEQNKNEPKGGIFTWKDGNLTFHGRSGLTISTKDLHKQYLKLKRQTQTIKKQPFAKALGIKNRGENDWVLDGTMGMGKDYFLACLFGFSVVGVEKSQLCLALVGTFLFTSVDPIGSSFCYEDTTKLLRNHFCGKDIKNIFKIKGKQFFSTNINGNKDDGFLLRLNKHPYPSTIYLDPMYDEMNETALPSKTMQVLREELNPSKNDHFEELFLESFKVARNRVVLKRSLKADIKFKDFFSFSCTGKSTRYDVYLKV